MSPKILEHLKKWFADYVAGFYTDNPVNNSTIRLKEKHTERVCENMILIGEALGLSDDEKVLTETMALFHDIGRFRQYAVYGTFKDADSDQDNTLTKIEFGNAMKKAEKERPMSWPRLSPLSTTA